MRTIDELSEQQEQQITADPGLLLVTFLVINGWKFDEILRRYTFSDHQLIQHLATLDHIKLIELLPNNRFSLMVSPHFGWRKTALSRSCSVKNYRRISRQPLHR
ncbi:hypothetical protein [Candidatus Reidiella endopervernicosa]|uniref:Uncharacterized protein n=1 Tax=Candidatus Reidiella endopervernicosa TaxID=2738883 RepID=A0A6N0HYX9_9GAMM|nr:hypothetical protein [Candidatus Reidiella endopervernicosa]QKQ27497.1 hypothetical protein HUE57_15305 [Candidatus Reidiella endopervernicosa]